MRLEVASLKAINYSCKNFHYSRSIPVNPFGFSVFNDSNEWCGCVIYSQGANNNIGKPYGLKNGEIIELTRMALNGKQGTTSKILSISLKLLPKYCPLVKLVISFADSAQKHIGVIYQASNWYFTGVIKTTPEHFYNGRWMHQRQVNSLLGTLSRLPENSKQRKGSDKLRYLYPLVKSLIPMCKALAKPYPKRGNSLTVERQSNQIEGGVQFDLAAQINS